MINRTERGGDDGNMNRILSGLFPPAPALEEPDLTWRERYRRIADIAWPALIEQVLISLCSSVDMIMVGRLGAFAVAAVGLTTQPRMIMQSVLMAFNVGLTALVARFKGQENAKQANNVLIHGLLVTLGLGFVLSVIGVLSSGALIRFMHAEADTIGPGTQYFSILMYGFLFTAVSMAITAALRGVGDTKSSLIMNLSANLLNVLLNYLLIFGHWGCPKLGVAGAAIATVCGMMLSCAIGFVILLSKKRFIFLTFKQRFQFDWEILLRMLRVGIPSMFEQFAMRIGLLLFTRTVSSLGTSVFAAHQICAQIHNLSLMTGQAFGISATTLAGQELGKGNRGMAYVYAKDTQRIGSAVVTVIAIFMALFARQLAGLFTTEVPVIDLCVIPLYIIALLQPFQSSNLILIGALKGAGDTRYVALSVTICVLGIRPLLSHILVTLCGFGLIGAWWSLFCDQMLRFTLTYLRYRSTVWLRSRV